MPPAGIIAFKRMPNLYKDSVALMQLAAALRAHEGIAEATAVMATPANLAQLLDADLAVEGLEPSPSDLLVVVRGEAAACEAALSAAEQLLKAPARAQGGGGAGPAEAPPASIAMGVERLAHADLALISVPGDYAGAEAMKALSLGLHVMLFSDNVPLAEERFIKTIARERGLLVMGPDCGTAIVNGVPLGFANVVRRGDIGVIAASGTGLQEVTCRIHNGGGGISQALGTGGRDLHEEIGGITMLQGLAALAADEATRVIVLVSKPPAPAIARRIEQAAAAVAAAGKPVVVHFLGAGLAQPAPGLHAAVTLQHAADIALEVAQAVAVSEAVAQMPAGAPNFSPAPPAGAPAAALGTAQAWAREMAASQWQLRGLFTGGTFCYEAQLALAVAGLACRSNAPAPGVAPWQGRPDAASLPGDGHLLLDLGDDDYTRGRAHPMIDPTLRDAAVRALGADAGAAVLLFDVVLGYGAHDDPARGLVEAMAEAQRQARDNGRRLAFIGHVCGTEGDPQGRAGQVAQLEAAGALVLGSNAQAAQVAAHLAAHLPAHLTAHSAAHSAAQPASVPASRQAARPAG